MEEMFFFLWLLFYFWTLEPLVRNREEKKFDLIRIVASSQTAVDEAPKKRWPREQHRSGEQIQYLFTLQFSATQFDAIKQWNAT